ncbi:MAG: type II toxin-antitoxin system RelE/ParE family toxin [Bacteroidetes bacterium]|nr:type II toxin-antitoxin system RelE/ParE family toxin [Bacteroidota bacterium]
MSYSFVIRSSVKADIINAADYYKKINPKLAKQFLFRIREAKVYISQSPLGFQIKYNQVRTLLLKQFPYHIHYIIDDTKQLIIILAVIHAYKNPMDYPK